MAATATLEAPVPEAPAPVLAPHPDPETLKSAYQLISRLFSNPEALNRPAVEADGSRVLNSLEGGGGIQIGGPLAEFLERVWHIGNDEYLATLELSPSCPLYLGDYAFKPPTTCAGVGHSDRNEYMIELVNLYRHFGFTVDHGELPDYLPAMVEFAWLSLDHPSRDLRREYLARYLLPLLPAFVEGLQKVESPYAHLARALEGVARADLAGLSEGGG